MSRAATHVLHLPLAILPLLGTLARADEVVRVPDLVVTGSRPGLPIDAESVHTVSLSARGLDWTELSRTAPGIHFNDSGTGTFGAPVSVRGLSNTPYFGDAALTTYLGDIPLAGPAATPALLPGLRESAWLRGNAASFALGRATSGGTLLLDWAPTPEEAGRLHAGFGDHGLITAEAGGAWQDAKLSVRVHAGLYQRNGYVKNLTLGGTVGDVDHRGANADLRWKAGRQTSLRLLWVGSQARDGEQPLVPMAGPKHTVERPQNGRADSDFNGVSLRADHASPLGMLTSISSYTRWSLHPYENVLVLPPRIDSRLGQTQSATNQEFRLRALPSADYFWSAGAFLSEGETEGDVYRTLFGTIPLEGSTYRLRQKTLAVFGQAVLMEDEGWSLEAGGRIERQRRDFTREETVPSSAVFDQGFQRTQYTPRLAFNQRLSGGSALSASWSEGYKPGGYSAYTARADLAHFAAERSRAWEVRWKNSSRSRWPLSLRAYRYDIRNYQVERSFTATDYLVVNAKHALSEGLEAETEFNLTSHWRLSASGGWLRTRLQNFRDPFTGTVFDGNPLPFTPSFTGRVDSLFALTPALTLDAGVSWTGRTYFTEGRDQSYSQNGYSVIEAGLRYTRGPWWLSTRVHNLTDRDYWTLIVPGIDHAVAGAPRHWSIEVGRRW